MKYEVTALLTAIGLACATAAAADEAAKELETFTGSWMAISVEVDGKKVEGKLPFLSVGGAKYVFRSGGEVIEGTHRLDPTKTPKQIDAVRTKGPDAGQTLKGIYELDRNNFKVCFAPAGKDRPTGFVSRAGEGQRLMTFKRAVKE
jgi:uncharacterized protein (TIGR03067 family)